MSSTWDRWWELPGPSRIVHSLARALREGSSTILAVPEHSPPGLDAALERILEGESRIFVRLTVPASIPPTPGGYLQASFCPDAPGDQLPSARNLAREKAFGGRYVWLSGVTGDMARPWRDFVVAYASACRTEPEWRRTAFILPLPASHELPAEDIALVCRPICDMVSPLDMRLFSAQLLHEHTMNPHHHAVAVAAIGRLASFDPLVALRLAQEPLLAATCPHELLRSLARERGWGPATTVDWTVGTADVRGRTLIVHSALLSVQNGDAELDRRLWSAQLEVYFPLLEQRRHQILSELDSMLAVPFQTPFGVITDKAELELGHIEYQIRNHPRASTAIRTQVRHLKELRNALAHFSPVPAQQLLHSEIESALGSVV